MSDPADDGSGSAAGAAGHSYFDRVVGALRLDAAIYEEVEHAPDALGQAAGVVALAALCRGIGTLGLDGSFVGGLLSSLIGWFISTGIVWAIGVYILHHDSDYPELLRTLGFASAPQILLVFGILPLGPIFGLWSLAVLALWIAAYVIAVRQALDVTTGRAIAVCLLAVLGNVVLSPIFFALGL